MNAPFDVERFKAELTMELLEIFAEAEHPETAGMDAGKPYGAPIRRIGGDGKGSGIDTGGD